MFLEKGEEMRFFSLFKKRDNVVIGGDYKFVPENRSNVEKEFLALARKENYAIGDKTINDFYYYCDIEAKSILVVGLGTNVRGNMQYVLNELNHNDRFKDYKIYVRTKGHTDDIVAGYIKQNNWDRTIAVPSGYSNRLESCKYLITESYFPYSWVKKPGQRLIDIWHGTPLKCLGLTKNGEKCHLGGIQQKNFMYSDYLLYPNYYTKEKMLDSYKVSTLLKAKSLMLGYPRTGGMLAVSEKRKKEIQSILAPNGEILFAYMPTFRGYLSNEEEVDRVKRLLDYLDKNLTNQQLLYVNLHHKVGDSINYDVYNRIKQFPPLIDSYELLSVTSALISDYSSVFFDYLASGKQIILHLEDYDTYREFQGLYMDVEELPFDKAYTKEEVLSALNKGKTYDDVETIHMFSEFDSIENAKKLCQLFLDDESGLILEDPIISDKRKIFMYSQDCKSKVTTELLREYVNHYDQNKSEVYIGCSEESVKNTLKTGYAYPLFYECPVISSMDSKKWFTALGQVTLQIYKDGKINFNKAFQLLQYDYALVSRRIFGDVVFDKIVIYDTIQPNYILGLALSDAKEKILFITKRMADKIENGDQYLKDAVIYASKYCQYVCTFDEMVKKSIKKIKEISDRKVIKVIDSVDKLDELI